MLLSFYAAVKELGPFKFCSIYQTCFFELTCKCELSFDKLLKNFSKKFRRTFLKSNNLIDPPSWLPEWKPELFIACKIAKFSGSEIVENLLLEIKPSTITAGQSVGFYKVNDTLNLTCIFRNDSILPNVNLEWIVPSQKIINHNQNMYKPRSNIVILIIKNVQETNSGVYKCRAVHNAIPFFNLENSVNINIKNKKKECRDVLFKCSEGVCISKRYTCDGFKDCPHGEDESSNYCGPGNPCNNKLMCPENRCIPFTWCCESKKEPNCTTKVKHSCCTHFEKLTQDVEKELRFQYEQQKFKDMSLLQTTVYTVIGCVMAFMFIVTIVIVAICRVQVRRTIFSRCSTTDRNVILGQGGGLRRNTSNALSFYDLDFYLNRASMNGNDLMNPLLVTYNINNGVHFVGRPVEPPPYIEVVTSPPKEGPPPPYASLQDLKNTLRRRKSLSESSEISENAAISDSDDVENTLTRSSSDVDVFTEVAAVEEETSTSIHSIILDTGNKYLKKKENVSEELLRADSVSSLTVDDVGKSVGEAKNSSLELRISNIPVSTFTCCTKTQKMGYEYKLNMR